MVCRSVALSVVGYCALAPFLNWATGVQNLPSLYLVGLPATLLISGPVSFLVARQKIAAERAQAEIARSQTELAKAHEALKSALAAKTTFIGFLSHEIRTPLTGVLGVAEALESRVGSAEAPMVRRILDSGRTLRRVLDDALDLGKIEAGELAIVPVAAQLETEIRSAVSLFEPMAAQGGVELTVSIDPEAPKGLVFDPVRVRQCLSNLISNAIKFADTRVRVSLRFASSEAGRGVVSVDVSDDGPGLDDAALEAVFSAYEQTNLGAKAGGTGLGLPISRSLAQRMGGDVVAARNEDGGLRVRLTFVADEMLTKCAGDRAAAPGARLSGVRVLVVDDTATNRMVARLFLEAEGADVSEARNGAEGLAALERASADVVLLDSHMPILDGASTLAKIRAGRHRDTPVLAFTASAEPDARGAALAAGMDGHIDKPIDSKQLIDDVAAISARRLDAGARPAIASAS